MEHYITEIKIENVRHLSDISISLDNRNRQHLLLTGKNGSGKTSVLFAIKKYLQALNDGLFYDLTEYLNGLKKLEKDLKQEITRASYYKEKNDFEKNTHM